MSYAVGTLIYGISLTEQIDMLSKDIDTDYISDNNFVSTDYSGNGITPYWLGEELTNIDECNEVDIAKDIIPYLAKKERLIELYEEKKKLFLEYLHEIWSEDQIDISKEEFLNRLRFEYNI